VTFASDAPLDKSDIGFIKAMSRELLVARAGWTIDESDIHVAIQTSVELLDACNRLTRATSATADNDVAEATA
tara:strand:+ start:533 stop:751 length:219 start_codon:yes stop_codon:yes gene_type:complete